MLRLGWRAPLSGTLLLLSLALVPGSYTGCMALPAVQFSASLLGLFCGLLLGSFLNVCISRLPDRRSIVHPRSHCPSCSQTLRWYDNVPLLSWLMLRARCRGCGARISWRYPAVEFGTGLWFALVAHRAFAAAQTAAPAGFSADEFHATALFGSLALLVLGFLLIGLLVMDWQTHLLPDAFTLTGTLLGFLFVCMQAVFLPSGLGDIKLHPRHGLRLSSPGSFAAKGNLFLSGTERMVFGRLAAIAGAALLLLAIRSLYFALRGRKRLPRPLEALEGSEGEHEASENRYGLGLGDVKLLAMLAAFLGFWPALVALFVGVIGCSVYAAVLLAVERAHARTRLPLGSFLAAGGLLAALFGNTWITWYSGLL